MVEAVHGAPERRTQLSDGHLVPLVSLVSRPGRTERPPRARSDEPLLLKLRTARWYVGSAGPRWWAGSQSPGERERGGRNLAKSGQWTAAGVHRFLGVSGIIGHRFRILIVARRLCGLEEYRASNALGSLYSAQCMGRNRRLQREQELLVAAARVGRLKSQPPDSLDAWSLHVGATTCPQFVSVGGGDAGSVQS